MPVPCKNCIGFHYGPCRQGMKQCYSCGGYNHMERYCPNNRGFIRTIPGQPLPGTRVWCDMHDLYDDPELKRKILQALKMSPGSAIWVNGICIYRGEEKEFEQDFEQQRGRPLEDRITQRRSRSPLRERYRIAQRRSRSPPRERHQIISRSPPRRNGRSPLRERGYGSPLAYNRSPRYAPRYRSRSPICQRRRAPSPYSSLPPRPRSPATVRGSNAVVFEARDRTPENKHWQPPVPVVKFNMPQPPPQKAQQGASAATSLDRTRMPLGQVSHNVPRNEQVRSLQQGSIRQLQSPVNGSRPVAQNIGEPFVGDPHFVLGISKGALENEIIDAYKEKIWEIELERMASGIFDMAVSGNSVWEQSIKILNAAKKQLVGY